MRNVSKPNEWVSPEQERAAGLQRITADLSDPAAVTRAVHQTGAQAAFIYAYVVFLSTSQVKNAGATKGDICSIERDHFIPWQHAQVKIGLEKLAPELPHDPIDPADIGRVAGAVLVNPRLYASGFQATNGSTPRKDVVCLSGPTLLSQSKQWDIINRELAAAGKPQAKVNHITGEQYLKSLAALNVPDMVVKSLAKSMVETRALYAAEDYEKQRGNVKLLTGRKATNFEDFCKEGDSKIFQIVSSE
ncbi:hypothetical protein DL764_005862 [Monosporascus ibericus]|uniref:NmrA-like domain-containing protein n=1 Tax=Monosporascus ibericus TaxID=155417 RepID=A0A4Q4T7F5_9PEZI|nr:hypothetical protein DL764_005862 [Monosporascus ibericus]